MSTFNGVIVEFPHIRVDFFRRNSDLPAPLACFLSHVHSDHLAGLESLRSPFVYCSHATREILLRLERYPCRINYAKGILEARVQTFKHLKSILKPLPLDTPVKLELAPGNQIQVTLFDANHCPGSVMFLFEGDGKAALYTGDIRSEPWHVNSLARNPNLLQYSSGLRTLDTIYLDTSWIDDIPFQTKAEGLAELLAAVSRYPPDTVFHVQAWTYGYEEVWIALSKALDSPIHVDDYKMRIYTSLVSRVSKEKSTSLFHLTPEAPALVGFVVGNTVQRGCLTTDENVRIHSCEKGNYCSVMQHSPVVSIQPVVTRLADGHDIAEVGVGGGADDLEREAELSLLGNDEISPLVEMAAISGEIPDQFLEKVRSHLVDAISSGRAVSLGLDVTSLLANQQTTIRRALQAIARKTERGRGDCGPTLASQDNLPQTITFPYSRHSSYPELCHLLSVFKPHDVWPCTVDTTAWLRAGVTIAKLFGQFCSSHSFRHDVFMAGVAEKMSVDANPADSQSTTNSEPSPSHSVPVPTTVDRTPKKPQLNRLKPPDVIAPPRKMQLEAIVIEDSPPPVTNMGPLDDSQPMNLKRTYEEYRLQDYGWTATDHAVDIRSRAFKTILSNASGTDWEPVGLLSTTDHHTNVERDLGLR